MMPLSHAIPSARHAIPAFAHQQTVFLYYCIQQSMLASSRNVLYEEAGFSSSPSGPRAHSEIPREREASKGEHLYSSCRNPVVHWSTSNINIQLSFSQTCHLRPKYGAALQIIYIVLLGTITCDQPRPHKKHMFARSHGKTYEVFATIEVSIWQTMFSADRFACSYLWYNHMLQILHIFSRCCTFVSSPAFRKHTGSLSRGWMSSFPRLGPCLVLFEWQTAPI